MTRIMELGASSVFNPSKYFGTKVKQDIGFPASLVYGSTRTSPAGAKPLSRTNVLN